MDTDTPLSAISGIGPTLTKRLNHLGLVTITDLIHHYPFRYEDFSKISKLSEVRVGETVTIKGDVWSIKNTYTKFHKVLTKAILNDGSSSVEIIWFNQPWLIKNIKAGDNLQVSGKIDHYNSKTSLVSPDWEKTGEGETIHTGRLVPVYPETYGVTSKWLRQKLASILPLILPQLADDLPGFITGNMLPLSKALSQIHFPKDSQSIYLAKQRLSFDELFYIQLATQKRRAEWSQKEIIKPLATNPKKLADFIRSLPFNLTQAQKRVTQEITHDLSKNQPMNRLLQGEVGSGKTVIAAISSYLAHLNELRTILMAPTEILAFQHYETFSKLLAPYGIGVGIYTGSRKYTKNQELRIRNKSSKKLNSHSLILNSNPSVIVGTHALLSEKLDLDDVGLVIIDEQQRFGVEQRSLLRNRAKTPHFLTMTATPIPRTVALTLYGDLDLSIIDEMPVGRKTVRTHFVPQTKRADAYKFITEQVKTGQQVYVITPLIEESETNLSAKAAKTEYERLRTKVFPQFKLGLLHGRLKSKEKEAAINDFKGLKTDILVSTSVVEVGMDIPNATIMVVEGAEKFGLAQLHQLRGRVGRGQLQSYTFLFAEDENPGTVSRLKNLEKIQEGLKLAELDLKIRGSGEIFGTMQSGRWNLKIASLSDLKLIEETKAAAAKILSLDPNLDKYPGIRRKLASEGKEIFPD